MGDDIRKDIMALKQQLRQEAKDFQKQKLNTPNQLARSRLERAIYRENLQEFATKKKEVMLLQYSLHIKQGEIERMENAIKDEEEKLSQEEKLLEEEASKFDRFLKENDKSCAEAMKKAEFETKRRLEKTQELKRLNHQAVNCRNELSKNEDLLNDLKKYREFLTRISPNGNNGSASDAINDDLYFTSPEQLLSIFSALEEANLSLIQVCQETEQSVEDLKKQLGSITQKSTVIRTSLKGQINNIGQLIHTEDARVKSLEEKIDSFSTFGNDEKTSKLLSELNHKVRDAYTKCIGEAENGLSTISMLTAIESKLEKIFDTIESLPSEKVEMAEKQREKERRQRLRDEKLESQKKLQEDRARKALERALAASSLSKKPIDRKELYKPRLVKKEQQATSDKKNIDEDELWKYLE